MVRHSLGIEASFNRNAFARFLTAETRSIVIWLRELLKPVKYIALIVDNYYRTRRGVNFVGVMARWVDADGGAEDRFIVRHAFLALAAHPISEQSNIATQRAIVDPIIDLYGLRDKIIGLAADHGSDIRNLLGDAALWLGCNSHAVHLCVKALCTIPAVQTALTGARDLATYVKFRHTIWSQVWEQYTTDNDNGATIDTSAHRRRVPNIRGPAETRWSSFYVTVHDILEHQHVIQHY